MNSNKKRAFKEEGADQPLVVIIDDDQDFARLLERVIKRGVSCRTKAFTDGRSAIGFIKREAPEVVVTDVRLPDIDGFAILEATKKSSPLSTIILITGYGTIEMAVEALKQGAYDFIPKPFDNDRVIHAVEKALERTHLLRENVHLKSCLRSFSQGDFIGRSPRLRRVISLIEKIAPTDVTVLIRGESGTGKELAARAIHRLSPRAERDLIVVNCPAVPEHILESELFGYRKGAFTGATRDKKGLFEMAHGSTILLDEIGDISPTLQTKLLRVLQEKEIHPLGATKPIKVDVRVLASTNQDLEAKIKQGLFREDLFYRLNVVTIQMPSLAEISEDIPLLARHFLEIFGREYGREELEFSPEALKYLLSRPWPGNVRELQNVIRRAVLLTQANVITPADLDPESEPPLEDQAGGLLPYHEAKARVMERFVRDYVRQALELAGGNVSKAARLAGLRRQVFQRLMRQGAT
ncbi:MAG TPA: sigma-54-dependent Fis family transcriptional regulator [Thermodesulfatator sp.]|nr:sigma-54-dependent Fis family transcriptional regulator [Thermodesulfatator sp.]